MIIPSRFHRIPLLLLLSPVIISFVGAQPPPPGNESDYPYAKFSPSMAIIIVVLIAALFFMGFFSVYIRHCTDSSGSIRRALSMGGRRGAAPRGLDAAVLETFPTFTYAEVKDHKIGQNALECAVCLNEFEDSETLRLIPKCDHVFHPECVDVWLQSHVTCPVCRANLVPQTADDDPVLDSEPTAAANDVAVERSYSRTGEIAVQIDENRQQQQVGGDDTNRASSFDFPTRPPRSWSVRTAKVFGLAKFRSHSTGHSLVQPGENLDRFTLRLPDVVRKEMMERAVLTRTGSYAPTLARERSSRRGYRTGGGEGTGWAGRFYSKMDKSEPEAKSDRWAMFTRGLSMRSTKVTAETGESSGSSGPPMKLSSFKCLEPKTADETGLMSEDRNKSPV